MWFWILCLFLTCKLAISDKSDSLVFYKCCPLDQNLIKVIDTNSTFNGGYECVNRDYTIKSFNITSTPLILSDLVSAKYGFPKECEKDSELEAVKIEEDIGNYLDSINGTCYDRLVFEVKDGELSEKHPKNIALTCMNTTTNSSSDSRFNIYQLRKCCPAGQGYDSIHRTCKNTNKSFTEDWLIRQLNLTDSYIYEVNNGLSCKFTEYSVDLIDERFSLKVEESTLTALSYDGTYGGQSLQGDWCIDRDTVKTGLIARVCTKDPASYGAYSIRKCCPIGEHYRVRNCKTMRSECYPDESDIFSFNISTYLEPLKHDYDDIPDMLGIHTQIRCRQGKYVASHNNPLDKHYLHRDGTLQTFDFMHRPLEPTVNYCLEEFDRRYCHDGEDVVVTAVLCFIKAPETKNFYVSFVMLSLSAVCLALTLVVYCALPELRNLHGRTLICHVSTMLLAYSCLARVQYNKVADHLCVFFGYSIYFGFVAAFAWLNVMCLDIWWTFGSIRTVHTLRKADAERRRFAWYSLYAWGLAFLLTLTMFLFDKYPVSPILDAGIGSGTCWFGTVQNAVTDWPHYIFFVIPMGLITCTNFVLWVMTARHCARVKSEVHRLQAGSVGDRVKKRFRVDRAKYVLTGKLWVVMGAGWVAELLSTLATEPQWLWNLVDMVTGLQGVLIFLILIMKPKLYYLIRKRLGLEKPDAQKNDTSSTARTSSTFLSRTISSDERTNLRISLPNNDKNA